METVNNTATGATSEFLVVLLGLMGILIVVAIVYVILAVIAWWKIFTKAGEKGWKSIIPIYGSYIQYKIAWNPLWFWITMALSCVASSATPQYSMDEAGNMVKNAGMLGDSMAWLAYIFGLAATVIGVIFLWKLAKAFGRGTGFFFGLVFLNFIFLLILAFGSSKYIGPEGIPSAAVQIDPPETPDQLQGV